MLGAAEGIAEGDTDGEADDIDVGTADSWDGLPEDMDLGVSQIISRQSKPVSVVRPTMVVQKRSCSVNSSSSNWSLPPTFVLMGMLIDMNMASSFSMSESSVHA